MKENNLLKLRNAAKAKKPKFLRQDANRLVRLSNKWIAPKGRHSKMRFRLRSYRKQPAIGYSSPKQVRGLTRQGHELIVINNISELEGVTTPIVIASKLGKKSRIEIIKKCQEKKIEILNIKDPNAYIKQVEDTIKKKKEEIKKRKEKKEKKKAEKTKEKPKEKEEKKTEDVEEKKEKEEKEKRKILEKKD